ncbi:XRE family transcriptional regulator [Pseudomonas aeruginosa]
MTQPELAGTSASIAAPSAAGRPRGLRVDSKTGELALPLVRVYRAPYALFGGCCERHAPLPAHSQPSPGGRAAGTEGQVQGLVHGALEYLDAIRGKV